MVSTIGDAEPSRVFGAVLLDTSVLYPLPLRGTPLRLAERDLFRPRWSALILEELRRNLVSDNRSNGSHARRLLMEMRRHFLNAEILSRLDVIERMTNAVEDRHVLAVAVEARAAIIVTSNLKDFLAAALAPHGIEARSPDDFLCALYDAAPTTVMLVLRDQAEALVAPPMTVDEVLTMLGVQTPRFVAIVLAGKGR